MTNKLFMFWGNPDISVFSMTRDNIPIEDITLEVSVFYLEYIICCI